MTIRSGTWTIVFTDLVGSTAQRTRIGDRAADALRREHDHIVADAVAERDGESVKSLGDGAMVAFSGAADALAAAVAIQQRVERRNRKAAEPLELRVGIAVGDALHEDDDLFGTVVVEAQRICAAADAGEVLLSATVRSIAGSRAETTLVPVGPRNLKGIPDPIDIWPAEWSIIDDFAVPFPARVPRAPEPISGDPDVEQYQLFEAMSSWLAALAQRSPVVLVLDDMHWASRPTVLMLRHVLRAITDEPLLVIATFRDTDVDD